MSNLYIYNSCNTDWFLDNASPNVELRIVDVDMSNNAKSVYPIIEAALRDLDIGILGMFAFVKILTVFPVYFIFVYSFSFAIIDWL